MNKEHKENLELSIKTTRELLDKCGWKLDFYAKERDRLKCVLHDLERMLNSGQTTER